MCVEKRFYASCSLNPKQIQKQAAVSTVAAMQKEKKYWDKRVEEPGEDSWDYLQQHQYHAEWRLEAAKKNIPCRETLIHILKEEGNLTWEEAREFGSSALFKSFY